MSQKIDFVIPWVNGSDPIWQEERAKYADYEGDKREIRFRDWDNLHYWFRGVEKFTPWVNKIFFITWGHLPEWLNTEHEKLVIVKHDDYIPSEYLPTFNSHTIELNLHRINDLSDTFVYFNDDTFVIDSLDIKHFFFNGIPCDCAVIMPNFSVFRNSTAPIVANNMEIVNTSFSKQNVLRQNKWKWFNIKYGKNLFSTICCMPYKLFAGFNNPHLPLSYLKNTYQEVWDQEYEVLNNTCLNKFRSDNDVNQWIIRYWQLLKGSFYPQAFSHGSCFSLSNNNSVIADNIAQRKYKMICLNDNEIEKIADFQKEKSIITKAFDKILPYKSSFEI